jgi:hypothetical protein
MSATLCSSSKVEIILACITFKDERNMYFLEREFCSFREVKLCSVFAKLEKRVRKTFHIIDKIVKLFFYISEG